MSGFQHRQQFCPPASQDLGGWVAPGARRTLPSVRLPQQMFSQDYSQTQDCFSQPEDAFDFAPPPRRTLPRPPSLPQSQSFSQPGDWGFPPRMDHSSIPQSQAFSQPRRDQSSLPQSQSFSQGASQPLGGRSRPQSQEGASRWKFSRTGSTSSGSSEGRERDLKHHLGEIGQQLTRVPGHIARLLQESVNYLDMSQEQGVTKTKQKMEDILASIKEQIEISSSTINDRGFFEKLQTLTKNILKELKQQDETTKQVLEDNKAAISELDELKKVVLSNQDALRQLCQEMEDDGRRQENGAAGRQEQGASGRQEQGGAGSQEQRGSRRMGKHQVTGRRQAQRTGLRREQKVGGMQATGRSQEQGASRRQEAGKRQEQGAGRRKELGYVRALETWGAPRLPAGQVKGQELCGLLEENPEDIGAQEEDIEDLPLPRLRLLQDDQTVPDTREEVERELAFRVRSDLGARRDFGVGMMKDLNIFQVIEFDSDDSDF